MCFHPQIRHIASCNSLKRFSLGFCPKLVPAFSKHLSKHNCHHQCCLPLEKILWCSVAVGVSQPLTRVCRFVLLLTRQYQAEQSCTAVCWGPPAWALLSLLTSEALCDSRGEWSSWAVGVIQAGCVSARTEAEYVHKQVSRCCFTFPLCRCPGFWWNSVGEQGCSYWDGERPACSEQRAKGSR